jgi:aerobic-type carbon monoxide dehydrogenase small subunit (CoxS/CutS family)
MTALAKKISMTFTLNGRKKTVRVYPMKRLLDVLREDARMTGSKEGCGEGECGACSIFLDGDLVNSCLVPALSARGRDIRTIEGVRGREGLHALQEAFIIDNGVQCGICTPGMIMAGLKVLEEFPDVETLDEETVRERLAGNLCRCTGYARIVAAVRRAHEILREQRAKSKATKPSKPKKKVKTVSKALARTKRVAPKASQRVTKRLVKKPLRRTAR